MLQEADEIDNGDDQGRYTITHIDLPWTCKLFIPNSEGKATITYKL